MVCRACYNRVPDDVGEVRLASSPMEECSVLPFNRPTQGHPEGLRDECGPASLGEPGGKESTCPEMGAEARGSGVLRSVFPWNSCRAVTQSSGNVLLAYPSGNQIRALRRA